MRFLETITKHNIHLYLLAFVIAFFLADQIVTPNKKMLKMAIALTFGGVLFILPQKSLILFVCFALYFPKNVPGLDHTTNALILCLTLSVAIRSLVDKGQTVSVPAITANPFFIPSLCIWLSYLVAWLVSFGNSPPDFKEQTHYFLGLTSALFFTNILIGYIRNSKSLRSVQLLLLLILSLNLFFGLLFLFFPGLTIIPGFIEDQSVMASSVNRIGGLTFRWEEYAEYLMIAVIILAGLWSNKVYAKYRFGMLIVSLLLLLAGTELLLTNTRISIFLAALGVVTVLFAFTGGRVINKLVICVGFCLVTMFSVYLAQESGNFSIASRIERLQHLEATEYGLMPKDRARVWLPALMHIADNGIAGYGPSMYPLTIWAKNPGALRWPHNLVLIILITVGLAGLLAYLFMFLRMLLLKRHLATITDNEIKVFYTVLWLAMLLFFIDTMKFDGFLRSPTNYFFHCFMLIGILFSAANFTENQNTQEAMPGS